MRIIQFWRLFKDGCRSFSSQRPLETEFGFFITCTIIWSDLNWGCGPEIKNKNEIKCGIKSMSKSIFIVSFPLLKVWIYFIKNSLVWNCRQKIWRLFYLKKITNLKLVSISIDSLIRIRSAVICSFIVTAAGYLLGEIFLTAMASFGVILLTRRIHLPSLESIKQNYLAIFFDTQKNSNATLLI